MSSSIRFTPVAGEEPGRHTVLEMPENWKDQTIPFTATTAHVLAVATRNFSASLYPDGVRQPGDPSYTLVAEGTSVHSLGQLRFHYVVKITGWREERHRAVGQQDILDFVHKVVAAAQFSLD